MLAKVIIENGQKKLQALTTDTGTGAPVGSIIVVCSNILPSGYLGLGVQYDITNYPALYQVLGTDTTPTASALGLPTLSSGQYAIKATSGLTENQQENVLNTINENNSYSTEEHATGKKWIDGKPIYSRTVVQTAFGSSVNAVPLNVDKIIKLEGIANTHGGNAYSTPYYQTSTDYWNFYIMGRNINSRGEGIVPETITFTLEYTKTTDN